MPPVPLVHPERSFAPVAFCKHLFNYPLSAENSPRAEVISSAFPDDSTIVLVRLNCLHLKTPMAPPKHEVRGMSLSWTVRREKHPR